MAGVPLQRSIEPRLIQRSPRRTKSPYAVQSGRIQNHDGLFVAPGQPVITFRHVFGGTSARPCRHDVSRSADAGSTRMSYTCSCGAAGTTFARHTRAIPRWSIAGREPLRLPATRVQDVFYPHRGRDHCRPPFKPITQRLTNSHRLMSNIGATCATSSRACYLPPQTQAKTRLANKLSDQRAKAHHAVQGEQAPA
jgi:hypothetical protein